MSAKPTNALGMLVDYGSNDSSSEDEQQIPNSLYESINNNSKEANQNTHSDKKLPLPPVIKVLYDNQDISDTPEDNPELHDGRIRSFSHQRGNWSTYVFIPFNISSEYTSMCEEIMTICNKHGIELKQIQDPHVSLTRTVILLHHWIDTFINSVREKISHLQQFFIQFGNLAVYCNEEYTRTFLGLTINVGDKVLFQSVKQLDLCLAEFKLPAFYENPSFHLSIAWILGNQKSLLENMLPLLEKTLQAHLTSSPELGYLEVTKYMCKSGNKMYTFELN